MSKRSVLLFGAGVLAGRLIRGSVTPPTVSHPGPHVSSTFTPPPAPASDEECPSPSGGSGDRRALIGLSVIGLVVILLGIAVYFPTHQTPDLPNAPRGAVLALGEKGDFPVSGEGPRGEPFGALRIRFDASDDPFAEHPRVTIGVDAAPARPMSDADSHLVYGVLLYDDARLVPGSVALDGPDGADLTFRSGRWPSGARWQAITSSADSNASGFTIRGVLVAPLGQSRVGGKALSLPQMGSSYAAGAVTATSGERRPLFDFPSMPCICERLTQYGVMPAEFPDLEFPGPGYYEATAGNLGVFSQVVYTPTPTTALDVASWEWQNSRLWPQIVWKDSRTDTARDWLTLLSGGMIGLGASALLAAVQISLTTGRSRTGR